jgi:ATP-dependent Clp protease adaptor protein ClpS
MAETEQTFPSPGLPAVIEQEPEVQKSGRGKEKTRHEPLWYVILHDDQLHSYEYVIRMLMDLFEMTFDRAFLHALEVDTQDVTIVARLSKEKATQKRNEIMSYGGDPWMKTTVSMKASIEPCDD